MTIIRLSVPDAALAVLTDASLAEGWFVLESFAYHAQIALHVLVLAGRDPHHVVEAQFKALARALRAAVALDPRVEGIPSAKGAL